MIERSHVLFENVTSTIAEGGEEDHTRHVTSSYTHSPLPLRIYATAVHQLPPPLTTAIPHS